MFNKGFTVLALTILFSTIAVAASYIPTIATSHTPPTVDIVTTQLITLISAIKKKYLLFFRLNLRD
ncbi:hypothetical protein [Moritella viscosa]|uniref:hypothetical protein n=1 Tax=Moritella viscosa TaxID=80854 RepID=UPI0005D2D724|nr:hypothetical protein [Moritella viscosa]